MNNFDELSRLFEETMKQIEHEQETFWNSLTQDQQLQVFCAVVRRIYKAEVTDRGSYRHVLYQVFGFGPESYTQAQDAGYLELHNLLVLDKT